MTKYKKLKEYIGFQCINTDDPLDIMELVEVRYFENTAVSCGNIVGKQEVLYLACYNAKGEDYYFSNNVLGNIEKFRLCLKPLMLTIGDKNFSEKFHSETGGGLVHSVNIWKEDKEDEGILKKFFKGETRAGDRFQNVLFHEGIWLRDEGYDVYDLISKGLAIEK